MRVTCNALPIDKILNISMRIINISKDYYLMAEGSAESFTGHLESIAFLIYINRFHYSVLPDKDLVDQPVSFYMCVTNAEKKIKIFRKTLPRYIFSS